MTCLLDVWFLLWFTYGCYAVCVTLVSISLCFFCWLLICLLFAVTLFELFVALFVALLVVLFGCFVLCLLVC